MSTAAFQNRNRQAIRAEINPEDKSTVVSILPKRIVENKITIQPGIFTIEPGTYEKPSCLVVGSSSWWRDVNPDEPLLEIPVSSISVARSIVQDYCSGLLASNGHDRMPGLFFVQGEKTPEQVRKEYAPLLESAKIKQDNWFKARVEIADVLWARSNGNPLTIDADARMAAIQLNLKNKPWLQDIHMIAQIQCAACGNLRNPAFPICPSCHNIIDKELYMKLGLTTAK